MNDYSSLPHRLNGRSIFRVLFSALTLAVGLVLAAGGLRLITLGGSSYYALAGVAYVILAFLYLKRHPAALHLTIAIFGATVIWALFDTPEFGFWALLPRLVVPALMFGLGLWASATLEAVPAKLRSASFWGGAATAGALILTLISAFFPHGAIYEPGNLSAQTPLALDKIDAPGNWAMFGRNANGTRFAPFNDINLENVSDLQVAWTYRTGRRTTGAGIGVDENTPLQIGNILYSCTPENMVTALDADTGKALWKFDPHAHSAEHVTCRGVGYYDVDADTRLTPSQKAALPDGICRQRLLISTVDARLIAIDAATGKPCADFGKGGTVDLAPGMGPVERGKRYHPTSVPLLMGHVAVVGGWVRDIVHGEPSGAVRAYDALTGKLAWVWDVGSPDNAVAAQQNPQFSLETPNVWTVPTYDRDLNLVYLPTGAGPPDYWGGDRNQAKEKFSAAIVAVDASTGRTRWVYQTVHHDVWDYDVPSQPVLYDVTNDKGLKVPALIQTTKTGNIFVLDRRTGKPVTRVVERAVTNNPAAEGDRLSPTQPFSVGMPIIGNDRLSERKMWGVSTFDQLYCRIMFKDSVYTGAFTPPGEKPYIEYPSLLGGVCERHARAATHDAGQREKRRQVQDLDGRSSRLHGHASSAGRWTLSRSPDRRSPVAAGRTLQYASLRHDDRDRPQDQENRLAGTAWHGARYWADGYQTPPADPAWNAYFGWTDRNGLWSGFLCRDPGQLPARAGFAHGQRSVEGPAARRCPGRSFDLPLAAYRTSVCRDLGRRYEPRG